MGNPNAQSVINSIDRAIQKAQETYKNVAWVPLCYCPEYFITTTIFNSLVDLTQKDSLTLESKPRELFEFLKTKKPLHGRPPGVPDGMRLNGRVDICLWRKGEDIPRAMIEVKRCAEGWIKDTQDIDRVAGSLLKGKGQRKFAFGILASCLHEKETNADRNKAEENIKKTVKDVSRAVFGEIKKVGKGRLDAKLEPSSTYRLPLMDKYAQGCENWIWRPVIFKIYRKKG